jgi:anti-anti-sigma factor
MPSDIGLDIDRTEKETYVRLGGVDIFELYDGQVQQLENELTRLLDEAPQTDLVFDLGNVTCMPDNLIPLLWNVHKRLSAAGKSLSLCNMRPGVQEFFEITKLPKLFAVRPHGPREWKPLGSRPI